MGRAGALLFGAASLVTVLALVLPHQPQVEEAGLVVVACVAALAALILAVGGDRLPSWSYPLFCACGTVIVTFSLIFNGERLGGHSGQDEMFYLWVALYAAYFFGRAMTAIQVALIAVAFAVALVVINPGDVAVSRWLSTVALVGGAAIVVRLLSERIGSLLTELRDTARTDHLTGLPNRRSFEEAMIAELARVRRGGPSFSVIVGDLDSFKDVNDRFGHATGDLLLVEVARRLEERARTGDLVARLGGDEFALLLPGTELTGALELGDRLALGLCENPPAPELTIGLSFGVATYGDDGVTMDQLLSAADTRLYDAKRAVARSRGARRRRTAPTRAATPDEWQPSA